MSETRFEVALKFVLGAEGGYTNDTGDPGGPTNFGITHINYDDYRTARGLPTQDIRNISQAEVKDIYSKNYWIPSHADGLPGPLDLVMFDCAVNQGISRAIMTLNQVFGISHADSNWETATSLAAHSITDVNADARAFIQKRIDFYTELAHNRPPMRAFLKGWLNRMDALKSACGLSGS